MQQIQYHDTLLAVRSAVGDDSELFACVLVDAMFQCPTDYSDSPVGPYKDELSSCFWDEWGPDPQLRHDLMEHVRARDVWGDGLAVIAMVFGRPHGATGLGANESMRILMNWRATGTIVRDVIVFIGVLFCVVYMPLLNEEERTVCTDELIGQMMNAFAWCEQRDMMNRGYRQMFWEAMNWLVPAGDRIVRDGLGREYDVTEMTRLYSFGMLYAHSAGKHGDDRWTAKQHACRNEMRHRTQTHIRLDAFLGVLMLLLNRQYATGVFTSYDPDVIVDTLECVTYGQIYKELNT